MFTLIWICNCFFPSSSSSSTYAYLTLPVQFLLPQKFVSVQFYSKLLTNSSLGWNRPLMISRAMTKPRTAGLCFASSVWVWSTKVFWLLTDWVGKRQFFLFTMWTAYGTASLPGKTGKKTRPKQLQPSRRVGSKIYTWCTVRKKKSTEPDGNRTVTCGLLRWIFFFTVPSRRSRLRTTTSSRSVKNLINHITSTGAERERAISSRHNSEAEEMSD